MKIVLIALLAVFLFVVIGYVTDIAITKSENHRCLVLFEQAEHYKNYYITKNEANMCAKFGIYPDAPIK